MVIVQSVHSIPSSWMHVPPLILMMLSQPAMLTTAFVTLGWLWNGVVRHS